MMPGKIYLLVRYKILPREEFLILRLGLNVDLKGAEADDVRDKTYQWPESDVFYSG
jgi:hypothetical protein